MKIANVETFPLIYPLTQPYGDANGLKNYRTCFLFRITTASGITGWGECTDWLPALQTGFRGRIIPFLLGKQASDRLQIVHHILKWHQRAAAGVSMALTEIMAKSSGLSICDFWGGRRRSAVPVYASFQSYSDTADWMKRSLQLVELAANHGFNRMKVKIGGKALQEDMNHINLIRQSLAGELQSENKRSGGSRSRQLELILDANQSYDYAAACEWEPLFAKRENWLWFEEPLPMNQVNEYRLLRSTLSVAIAGGENLLNASDFLLLLRAGAVDMIQPDAAHVDGIDGFRHILQLARDFGLRTSPHTFDSALSRLYTLFAQACLPPWTKMPEQNIEPIEWDVMENPFTAIVPVNPVAGVVSVPAGVGIGVEVDMDLVKKYRWDGSMYR